MNKNRIIKLREALDILTEGGLSALQAVARDYGLTPYLTVQTQGLPPDYTRVIFYATKDDEVLYFDTALLKGTEGRMLAIEVDLVEKVYATKKTAARVQKELTQQSTAITKNGN